MSTTRRIARRSAPRHRAVASVAKRPRAALIGLAVLGLIVSAYLAYVSHRLHGDVNFQSLCALNAQFDCDRVVSSPYGSVGGTPLAWFGVWFYGLLVLVALFARRSAAALGLRSPALVLLLLSGFAVGLSVALAMVSVAILHAVCLLCATLYAVNFGLLFAAWMALRSTGETLATALSAERLRRPIPKIVLSTSLIAAGLVLTAIITYRLALGPPRFCALVSSLRADAGQPIRLTIYSDVQCPHCLAVDKLLRPIRSLPGIQITSRQYPLDPVCNPRTKVDRHVGACRQARALLCARTFGRYDDLSDRLFDGGPHDQDGLLHLAASLGIDERAFGDCLESTTVINELAADLAAGRDAGVRGTPTIILEDGSIYSGELEADDIACLAVAASGRHP